MEKSVLNNCIKGVILLLHTLTTNQKAFLHYIMCFVFDGSFFKFPFLAEIGISLKINLDSDYSGHFKLLLFLHKRSSLWQSSVPTWH